MQTEDQAVVIRTLEPGAHGSLRFEVAAPMQSSPQAAAVVEELWNTLRRENPRLFDGPVLLAEGAAKDGEEMVCRRATYKTLVTAHAAGLSVRALGVQGVLVGRDRAGDEHVLLGRRSSGTRIYGGQWENAPSGTIKPPVAGAAAVDWPHIMAALHEEGLEELGLNLDASRVGWAALMDDPQAQSLDVVVRLEISGPIDPRRVPCACGDNGRWEYSGAAWALTSGLGEWIARDPAAVSPPTRALMRHLGWA